MGDFIKDLKTDMIPIDLKEQEVLQRFFPDQYSKITRMDHIYHQLLNIFYIGLLFFLINFSYTEKAIQWLIPSSTKNVFLFLFIKTFLFVLVIWVLLNISYFFS